MGKKHKSHSSLTAKNLTTNKNSNKYINGYVMFLSYPVAYVAFTLLIALIYQKNWSLNFILPAIKHFFDFRGEITKENIPYFILCFLFLHAFLISGWFSLTFQAFHSVGLVNNNPRENRSQLSGMALRLLGNHQNSLETAPLLLAAVIVPILTKMDIDLHLTFLLIVFVASIEVILLWVI
ncbi:hypothetical protein HDU92_001780 [Lobulomyces angularis]|nr:hypothetical protein HDU92_001780 [Lobulomyces angularis]